MMRVDRYGVVVALGVPILLATLSMLARTELVIGSRIRSAVEARMRPMGADIEILTVSPSGLWSVELEQVSARIPRGDFAVEVDVESVVVTPSLGTLFGGRVALDAVEVNGGIVAIVPWNEPPKPKGKAPAAKPAATKKPAKAPQPEVIDVTLVGLDVIALNDAYRSLPLQLGRVDFEWTRGAPIDKLAGYGQLPDGVGFSIGAEDGVYRLQPQSRTRVDRWVAPRAGGVGWPVSLQTRDIRICLACESVVALEDLEIAVPEWRDDVRITAPVADVSRRGREVSLGALEMAIVDANTGEYSARITESEFHYALDSGHLSGVLELAAQDGGKLGWTWSWDAADFIVDFEATRFPLSDVWYLSGLGDRVQPKHFSGTAKLAWDMPQRTLGVQADLGIDAVTLTVPYTDEVIDVTDGRFAVDLFVDVRGRSISVSRAAFGVGDALPLEVSGLMVDANNGVAFDGRVRLAEQDVARLVDSLPHQWTAAATGAEFGGNFGFEISAAGHSAFPESLVLDGQLHGDVTVAKEGRANVRAIGRSGPPPMRAFPHWTSLSAIGKPVWEVVLAAEDAQFFNHDGFDFKGIERAMVHNLRAGRPVRGGSTISQQVAKNLFLDGKRSLARKLQEAYLTWRLESLVPKRRILEIYLNIAEWGAGVRGLGQASQHYFGVPPRQMRPVEVAMLAAILPNPHRFGGWIDKGYLATSRLQKVEHILRNLKFLQKISGEQYRSWWKSAQAGKIGRLQLKLCDDRGRNEAPACS